MGGSFASPRPAAICPFGPCHPCRRHFPNVSFPEGSATYITLKGSAAVKRVRVEGHRAPAPTHGIAVCLSQFHNRIPNRVLLEFLVWFPLQTTLCAFIFTTRR